MLKRADWQALQPPKASKPVQLEFSFPLSQHVNEKRSYIRKRR
jgi:hypothetical protein